ncbi:hypothetical protein [Amycolatopsis sp. cmx-8-4]|uniref:hypothetical protein n=1 Tax=Amycolatopsis sp. cmx-8-4 TaxID=2790947 RepID=UPI003979BB8F
MHVPGRARDKPWLWLDLDGPSNIFGKIPLLARSLLDVFDASTHEVHQGSAVALTDVGDIASLVEAVCDPRRRTLVFVAGSDPRLPFDRWLELVRNLLRETVGLAGGYVLSPEATEAFNNAIGPAHQITPWTVPGTVMQLTGLASGARAAGGQGRRHRPQRLVEVT